jgi:hypothetical protein
MGKVLEESLSNFSDRISDAVKSRKNILVTTHIDCDGITSGSIISKALIRHGAKCTVRTTNEFSENLVERMQKETRDLHVITDLGGGFGRLLVSFCILSTRFSLNSLVVLTVHFAPCLIRAFEIIEPDVIPSQSM